MDERSDVIGLAQRLVASDSLRADVCPNTFGFLQSDPSKVILKNDKFLGMDTPEMDGDTVCFYR